MIASRSELGPGKRMQRASWCVLVLLVAIFGVRSKRQIRTLAFPLEPRLGSVNVLTRMLREEVVLIGACFWLRKIQCFCTLLL